MCVNIVTGVNVMAQQCGVGYLLTMHGCVPPCPSNPQQGLYGTDCENVISGSNASGSYYGNTGGYGFQPSTPGYGTSGYPSGYGYGTSGYPTGYGYGGTGYGYGYQNPSMNYYYYPH